LGQGSQRTTNDLLVRCFLFASFSVGWWLALQQQSLLQPLIAATAAVLLLKGARGHAQTLLTWGALFIVGLLLKDLWPSPPPLIAAWRESSGLTGDPASFGIRNPQLWNALKQAGSLAAACLGVAALHNAWTRGFISRRLWLSFLAFLLLGWCLWVLMRIDLNRAYDETNFVFGVRSKNAAATLSAMSAILCLGLAWHSRRQQNLMLALSWLLGLVLSLWLLASLRSWTGVMGTMAGSFLLAGAGFRRGILSQARWIWALTAVVALLVALVMLSPELARRMGTLQNDYRLSIWKDCLPLVREAPLGGIGLGGFEGLYPLSGQLELAADARLTHPDSSWALLVIEWGLLPSLLLAGGAAWLVFGGRGAAPPPTPGLKDERIMHFTTRAGVVVWLVCGLTDISLHRPETALLGCSLIALLPQGTSLQATSVLRQGLAFLLCGILVATGQVARLLQERAQTRSGFKVNALFWDPLNPKLHWNAALQAGNEFGNMPRAIAHFRAMVTLDHCSMQLAEQIARMLAPTRPEEAMFFWTAALKRGRADPCLGFGVLQRALKDFPALAPDYWEGIVAEGNPDQRVVLASQADMDGTRLLRAWIRSGGASCLRAPALTDVFFKALERAGNDADLLEELLARQPPAPRSFFVRSAQLLLANGRPDSAWSVLMQLEPFASQRANSELLVPDANYHPWQVVLRELAASGESKSRLRMLEELCKQPKVPLWFHMELGGELRAAHREREAVVHLLDLIQDRPGQ
jgi:O-antigen ligase